MDHPNHASPKHDTRGRLSAQLGGDASEIPAIRHGIAELADLAGFRDRAGDVTLAIAELIANAQEHGRPPVSVDAWVDGRLVIEVRDAGGGMDQGEVWRTHPPSPHGNRGRGLWIVRQLVDVVAITTGEAGTTVHVELSPEPHLGA